MRIVIIIWVCLALAMPAFAGLYKWTDENGKIHFTNDPSQIPLDHRNKKDMKKLTSDRKEALNTPNTAPKPKQVRKKIKALKKQGTGLDTNEVKRLRRLMQK